MSLSGTSFRSREQRANNRIQACKRALAVGLSLLLFISCTGIEGVEGFLRLPSVNGGDPDPVSPGPEDLLTKSYFADGPYAVGELVSTAKLNSRDLGEDVAVIYYFPVNESVLPDNIEHSLVFIPGNSFLKEDYEEAFTKVASYGVMVAVLDFPNSNGVNATVYRAEYQRNFKAHMQDLDANPASDFFNQIPDGFTFGGHSWGSAGTMYNAVLGEGDSFIVVDGVTLFDNYPEWTGQGVDFSTLDITKPILHLNGASSPYNMDHLILDGLASSSRYVVNVDGASHYDFMNSTWNLQPVEPIFSAKVSSYFAHYVTMFIKAIHTNLEIENSDKLCLDSQCANIESDDGLSLTASTTFFPPSSDPNFVVINDFNRSVTTLNNLGRGTSISHSHSVGYPVLEHTYLASPAFRRIWPELGAEVDQLKYNKLKIDLARDNLLIIRETIGSIGTPFDASSFRQWSMDLRQNDEVPVQDLEILVEFQDVDSRICSMKIGSLEDKSIYGVLADTFVSVYADFNLARFIGDCDMSALLNFELEIQSESDTKLELDNFYFHK